MMNNLAGRPGFEPGLSSPEPEVLPLNYLPIVKSIMSIIYKVKELMNIVDSQAPKRGTCRVAIKF